MDQLISIEQQQQVVVGGRERVYLYNEIKRFITRQVPQAGPVTNHPIPNFGLLPPPGAPDDSADFRWRREPEQL